MQFRQVHFFWLTRGIVRRQVYSSILCARQLTYTVVHVQMLKALLTIVQEQRGM